MGEALANCTTSNAFVLMNKGEQAHDFVSNAQVSLFKLQSEITGTVQRKIEILTDIGIAVE